MHFIQPVAGVAVEGARRKRVTRTCAARGIRPFAQLACGKFAARGNVNRKHAPKSEPAAILAAKKTFDMLLLPVGFFYSELDMWSFCDHD